MYCSTFDIINNDVFFEITEPIELEYTYRIKPAKDFGGTFNSNFKLRDVALVPIIPPDACLLNTVRNADEIRGNVALVERGDCSFLTKTINIEKLGGKAVIITESTALESDNEIYIEMVDDDSGRQSKIPAGFLLGKNGKIIKNTLNRLQRSFALINLNVNLTFVPVHMINSPPWLGL